MCEKLCNDLYIFTRSFILIHIVINQEGSPSLSRIRERKLIEIPLPMPWPRDGNW